MNRLFQMKLRYHHVTMKVRCRQMPILFWQYLLKSLKIVYAAYDFKRDGPKNAHYFYMLYEDDAYLRNYVRHLEQSKPMIMEYLEEHDMSEANLRKISSKYDEISPKECQVDNISLYHF